MLFVIFFIVILIVDSYVFIAKDGGEGEAIALQAIWSKLDKLSNVFR
jgi:hypothetical protein